MARRATVLLIDDQTCRGVAGRRLRHSLTAQLLHICDNAPDLGVGGTEGARHFRIGNPIADYHEYFAVGAAVSEPACIQRCATSSFAVPPVTVTAPANE